MEENAIKTNQNGSYTLGTVGAIIGGAVAAIPWILTYCFANMIVAILAFLIAYGAFIGYKLFKGKIGKPLPIIIAIVSILTVIIATLVVCPLVMMARENLDPTLKNLQLIYEIDEFMSAMMQDLLVSLIFTILGIATSLKSVYIQIKQGTQDIKFNEQALVDHTFEEAKQKAETVKKAFETLNAFDNENAVGKQEIINELELTYNVDPKKANQYFKDVARMGIIKKEKGKYYYNTNNEEQNLKNSTNVTYNNKTAIAIVVVMLAIMAIVIIFAIVESETDNSNEDSYTQYNSSKSYEYALPGTDLKLNIPSDMKLYSTEEEIEEILGSEYSNYYNFVIITNNYEAEIYGLLVDKSEIDEEYTLDQIAIIDRENAANYYSEVSELVEEKYGTITFKRYGYKDEENNFSSYIYIAEVGDKYMCIDTYSDVGEEEKIVSAMKEIFEEQI